MVKWDTKLDSVRVPKVWYAADGDKPPSPPPPPTAPSVHFWLGDVGERPNGASVTMPRHGLGRSGAAPRS